MNQLTPVRREVIVAADAALAFRVFTEQIGAWWPVADLSVHGEHSSVAFVGDRLLETAAGQPDAVWGTVTAWEPPDTVAFTWHPGRDADRASQVRVTFAADGEHTLVRLEHTGWERFENPVQARAEYDQGWPPVLERYQGAVDIWPRKVVIPAPPAHA